MVKKTCCRGQFPLSDGLFLFGLLGGDGQFVIYGCAVWSKGCGFVATYPSPLAVAIGNGFDKQFVVAYPAEVEVAIFIPAIVEIVAQRNHVVCRTVIVIEPQRAVEVTVVSLLPDEYAVCPIGASLGLHESGVDEVVFGHHERLVGQGGVHDKLVLLGLGEVVDGAARFAHLL